MDVCALIEKRKAGCNLTEGECREVVEAYLAQKISDCQMTALLMTFCLKPSTLTETVALTRAIAGCGKQVVLTPRNRNRLIIDRHSSGGVGDKMGLILNPILAALGYDVAKFSGSSISFMGSTIDKLRSVGVVTDVGANYQELIDEFHFFNAQHSADYVPADRRLSHLRDQTGTLNSPALIASSILAKKVIVNSDYVFIDLKVGTGSLCKTMEEGLRLASLIDGVMQHFPQKTAISFTPMNQPLGRMVGNQNEVLEAIWFLEGDPRVPNDLKRAVEDVVVNLLLVTGVAPNVREAKRQYVCAIDSRRALKIMFDYYLSRITDPEQRKRLIKRSFWNPRYKEIIYAPLTGFVSFKSVEEIGKLGKALSHPTEGGFDGAAGIEFLKKWGDRIKKGEPLAVLYADRPIPPHLVKLLMNNITIHEKRVAEEPSGLTIFSRRAPAPSRGRRGARQNTKNQATILEKIS